MTALRQLLAFCAGAISASLLSHGTPWSSALLPSVQAEWDVANRSIDSPQQAQPQELQASKGCIGATSASQSSLDDFVDLLENLTVRHVWTAQVMGEVSYYRQHGGFFGNKADFAISFQIMDWYAQQGRCTGSASNNALVLLAGANKGQSTGNVLSACPKARMHIFEIVLKLFEIQQKRFKDSSLVTVHRKGWSDKVQTFRITVPAGESELAGLFAPAGKWKTAPQLNGTVETIPLADFVTEQGIFDPVSYVLIDVEGKEPNVIRGMKLERNRHIFPLFQYELGGTWTDSRHDADQWGQYGIAVYLRALGYNLYLAGADGGEGSKKPVLLSLHPEFFRFTCLRPEIDVGGNLLAVHTSFIDSGLWEHLQKFVVVPKPQFV